MAVSLGAWQKFKSWYYQDDPEKPCYHVHGYKNCKYFQDAKCAALEYQRMNPDCKVNIVEIEYKDWHRHLAEKKIEFEAYNHRTSPFIFQGCNPSSMKFIGGCDNFLETLKERHNFESEQCPIRDPTIYMTYKNMK